MNFKEDYLHYIWQFKLFAKDNLKTSLGDDLTIHSPGIHNKHAGPDFENAQILLENTTWAGSVEIHLRSSDWERHQHTTDRSYDNVILHVVFDDDKPVYRTDGTQIPALVLNGRIPAGIERRYTELMQNLNWIPCEKLIRDVDDFYVKSWLSRILIERLEEKSHSVYKLLEQYKGSWDNAFYISLARNFGFKTNGLPFELFARSLPQEIFARHKNNALQIEALVFGQAGFLTDNLTDEYPVTLRGEYAFLKKKYKLKTLDQFLWKFLRLRPQNFPTLRLAQFAALVVKSNHLFSKIIEIRDAKTIRELFSNLPVNSYWQTHFRFDKSVVASSCQPGEDSVNNILVNTVAVFLFSYGKHLGKSYLINRAIALLESLPAETNQVTRRFTDMGIKPAKADASQALLQLKKVYCDTKKCLTCGIGVKLINRV